LAPERFNLLQDEVLGSHLRGEVCDAPRQGDDVRLEPLETLVRCSVADTPSTTAIGGPGVDLMENISKFMDNTESGLGLIMT
jgi:hypothetical protein